MRDNLRQVALDTQRAVVLDTQRAVVTDNLRAAKDNRLRNIGQVAKGTEKLRDIVKAVAAEDNRWLAEKGNLADHRKVDLDKTIEGGTVAVAADILLLD